jgi:transketolase
MRRKIISFAPRSARAPARALSSNPEQKASRDGYGAALLKLGKRNPRVVVLSGDLAESTRVQAFAQKYPDRFYECGVAEQNMVSVAAGLALTGYIPFVSSFAVFVPGRAWEQIRIDVAYQQANVKLVGSHAGVTVGADGATHQALEDIALMRTLPNFVVLAPCDYWQTYQATLAAAAHEGPVYLRFARPATPLLTTSHTPFQIGRAYEWREGMDVALVAAGPLVYEALRAAERLARQGISARVINCPTIKPLDEQTILAAAMECGAVVTCEEHQLSGGLGSAVSELLAQHIPTPQEFVAVPDCFGESGSPAELLRALGLDARGICQAVHRVLKRKRR